MRSRTEGDRDTSTARRRGGTGEPRHSRGRTGQDGKWHKILQIHHAIKHVELLLYTAVFVDCSRATSSTGYL